MKDKFQNERDISKWTTPFLEADFSWMKQDVQEYEGNGDESLFHQSS